VNDTRKKISIIYYQKNNSPKYLEINKKKFLLFLIGLPTITLIAISLASIGVVQSSPFHLLNTYRQNSKARIAIANSSDLQSKLNAVIADNKALELKLQAINQPPLPVISPTGTVAPAPTLNSIKCPEQKTTTQSSSIGLSTLSFFKPVNGQQDKTRPASLNLTGFKVNSTKDQVNLQFNIINLLGENIKLAGHIVVLMKTDSAIQVYPQTAFITNDFQVNYSAGEPFATQRFRPVDAVFIHPKKSGNFMFTVFIFSRTGDLLHYQNTLLPVH
jgi:hypothetical protein